ncbi:MAG: ABC transporter ATP-binding protein/permease [Clostridia bacterium]|nr:ABC transporter ATP-binding protein/permease [Clostridia bacterium]
MKKDTSKMAFFGLGRLSPYLKPYRGMFVIMIVTTIAVGVADTFLPLFQEYAIDNYIAAGSYAGIWLFVAIYALFIIVPAAIDFWGSYTCCKVEMFLLHDLRGAIFQRLQTYSVAYFNENSVGALHSRTMSDTDAITSVLSWDTYEGGYHVAYTISAVIIMFLLNVYLALIVLVIVPAVAAVYLLLRRRISGRNAEVREANARLTSDYNEGICGAPTAKTLGMEKKLEKTFSEDAEDMRKKSVWHQRTRHLMRTLITFVSFAALAAVLWYGGVITAEGVILIGTLSVFMTYAEGLATPVQWAADALSDLISIKVNVKRIDALMSAETDVRDTPEVTKKYGDTFSPKKENWEEIEGDIEFDGVTFRYPDGDVNILEDFSLKIPRGKTVAVVGETGAGKSTLINLVCRFSDPTEGRVLIDGRDARERSVQWLHSSIGCVLQTPHLFSGTLRENLLYGNPDASDEDIETALRTVFADGVAERLGGLDAVILEGGANLSMGERQLLSFARAILADPKIFILDEATSSIDSVTEGLIQKATGKILEGRTSLIIAHRLSTVREADDIFVMDAGKIVEEGTHGELLQMRGRYFELYSRQLK